MQKEGREFAARSVSYESNESFSQLTMDIAPAYPPEAGLNSWIRKIRLNREKNILITDSYNLKKAAQVLTLSLMTPCEVTIDSPGKIILKDIQTKTSLSAVSINVNYNADKFTPTIEDIEIKDNRLKTVWGSRIIRIILQVDKPEIKDTWELKITQ